MKSGQAQLKFKILPATKDDIPALGTVLTASHGPELIMSLFFPTWPNLENMVPYYTSRIAAAFEGGEHVFKAVDGEGRIVGCVRMGVQSGEKLLDRKLVMKVEGVGENEGEMKLAGIVGAPPDVNMASVGEVMKGLSRLDEVMVGRKYFRKFPFPFLLVVLTLRLMVQVLQSLAVLPAYQGKGIGKKLMQQFNAIGDKEGLPIYLTAFPGAHGIYLYLGYEDKDYFDVDLNAWSREKYRGYGIYRSYGMVREPHSNFESESS